MNPNTKSVLVLLSILLLAISAAGQNKKLDTERSVLKIHVGKAGLLSAAGHEHWVRATAADGGLNDTDAPQVAFKIHTQNLSVLPDDRLSADKQAEVQRTMQSKVLESDKYPEIAFRSTNVQPAGQDRWVVLGDLTLHGQTKPVRVEVARANGVYTGRAKIKQTDFGIKPISVGGVVKVKNELDVEFSVATVAGDSGASR